MFGLSEYVNRPRAFWFVAFFVAAVLFAFGAFYGRTSLAIISSHNFQLEESLLHPPPKTTSVPVHPASKLVAKGNKCGIAVAANESIHLEPVALASAPGSGNTWMRWLIERLTGICTGSAYFEEHRYRAGFLCADKKMKPGAIVYKTHSSAIYNATKTLLLLRHPADAAVAEFNRMSTSGNQTGVAELWQYLNERFQKYMRTWCWMWLDLVFNVFRDASSVLVVFYEDLKQNLAQNLRKVARYLDVDVDDERIRCVLENQTGSVKRKRGRVPDGAYKEVDLHVFDAFLAVVYRILVKNGISVADMPKFYVAAAAKFYHDSI